MDPNLRRVIIVLCLVILIYIAVTLGADHPYLVSGLVAVAGYWLFKSVFEGMTSASPIIPDNQVVQNGALAFDRDYDLRAGAPLNQIDPQLQRQYAVGYGNSELDNTDVVMQSIAPNALFQPINQGVSATSNAQLSNFTMGEPGYSIMAEAPQTNLASADELVARKQQHNLGLSRRAIDGAVRSTRNKFDKYFQNELTENEGRVWWSSEASEADTDFEYGG